MPRKAYIAITVAAAVVIVAVAVFALAPKGAQQQDQGIPSLSTAQPVSGEVTPVATEEEKPSDDGPAPCTFDDAYGLAQAITDGTYDFTAEGWGRLVSRASTFSLAVDEASVKPPFVQYEARTLAAMKVFATMNDDASFVKTGDSSWNITVSVRRAASPINNDSTGTVRANLRRLLKTEGDAPQYRAQVTYSLVISDGKGTLSCTSPDWYL